MAAISARIAAHTKALYAVLPAGLARRHHGNPAASLRVHQLYGIPVLLSGLPSLVLSNQELGVLDHHHKTTLVLEVAAGHTLVRYPPPCA